MSHFNVAVFTTDDSLGIDELLAPYDEDIVRAPYIEYTKQEAIEILAASAKAYQGKMAGRRFIIVYKDAVADCVAYKRLKFTRKF